MDVFQVDCHCHKYDKSYDHNDHGDDEQHHIYDDQDLDIDQLDSGAGRHQHRPDYHNSYDHNDHGDNGRNHDYEIQEHEGTHILQSLDGFAISLASDGRYTSTNTPAMIFCEKYGTYKYFLIVNSLKIC